MKRKALSTLLALCLCLALVASLAACAVSGEIGPVGPQGEKGDTGATGAVGPQGEKGDTGATGAVGPQGEKGDTGATGAVGPQGEKGDTGATGAAGSKGEKGDSGTSITDVQVEYIDSVSGTYFLFTINYSDSTHQTELVPVNENDTDGKEKNLIAEKLNSCGEAIIVTELKDAEDYEYGCIYEYCIENDGVVDGKNLGSLSFVMDYENAAKLWKYPNFGIETVGFDAYQAKLNVKNIAFNADGYVVYAVKADSDDANDKSELKLENVAVNTKDAGVGIIAGRNATITLDNVTVYQDGLNDKLSDWHNSALAVENCGRLIINGGTYTSTDGYALYIYSSGGYVEINGGTFEGDFNVAYGDIIIKGGSFTFDPTSYVADGFEAIQNGDIWTVSEIQ